MTVVWKVYSMQIPYKIPQTFSVMIEELNKNYQDYIWKMKVSRVEIHDYLIMTLEYRTPGELNINITE